MAETSIIQENQHYAVFDAGFLYVWGGYVIYENHEVYLPNDEIWVYELENGTWQKHAMKGDLPPPLSRSCAACLNGIMYIFGGYDGLEYTNEMYCVNLQVKDATYIWKKLRNCQGICPTPRHELSCWVHKDRLIYFGGYGCKRISELNDSFYVNEASWEEEMFWGWNCEIHVFDPSIQIWYQPTTKGMPPRPRAAHACAVLGNKGYLFGGRILETRINDLHCLDLDSWTWSGEVAVDGIRPQGRLWHTLTPVTDDQLFLFGGLSAESQLLSDAWIYSVGANEWRQFAQCLKNRPRQSYEDSSVPGVEGGGGEMELGIIRIHMEVDPMSTDDITKREQVNVEKEGTKGRALRDATCDGTGARAAAVTGDDVRGRIEQAKARSLKVELQREAVEDDKWSTVSKCIREVEEDKRVRYSLQKLNCCMT
ncbi:kelch domain-containing protein 1 isoform X1 [Callorhinchus milii]|uniref:kelch domain-containing protein 1 isoform X1 n=2 Tax=Callorhinchus milii TaxID=7868 RepID=UPI001C3FB840|nr:kelch domain-containing protein 1 isoform X1 [Callorhinchus milii]